MARAQKTHELAKLEDFKGERIELEEEELQLKK